MGLTYGKDVAVAIASEAAYNEAWAFPTYGIRHDTITLNPSIELMQNNYASGQGFDKLDSIALGRKMITVGLTIKLHKEHLGYFLKNICGAAKGAIIGAGPFYRHMFTVPAGTPASFRMVVQLSDKQYQIRGLQIQKMDLDFKVNDWIMVTLNCIGGDYTDDNAVGGGTITYAAISGEPGYKFLATNWSINGVTTGWGQLTLTLERQYADGVEDSYEAGYVDADGLAIRKRLESSSENQSPLSIMLKVIGLRNDGSLSLLQKALTTFESFLRIGGPIDTQAYYLTIDMGKCKLIEFQPVTRGLGMVQDNATIKAFHDAGTFYAAAGVYPASDFRIIWQSNQTSTSLGDV